MNNQLTSLEQRIREQQRIIESQAALINTQADTIETLAAHVRALADDGGDDDDKFMRQIGVS